MKKHTKTLGIYMLAIQIKKKIASIILFASTSETGHAKNVANLNTLISRCTGYGTRYNPTNTFIQIPNMTSVKTASASSLVAVNNASPPYTLTVNTRKALFDGLPKLATRVKNALDATQGVSDATVDDALTIVRKIRGARKNPKVLAPPPPTPTTEPTVTQISVSQRSYDMQVEHLNELLNLVASVTGYMPNETEVQPSSLQTFENQLRAANDAVVNATTPYINARQSRDNNIYTPVTGLVDVALEAKNYVKSVSTITLAEFRQISGLKFTRPKKKK